MAMLLRKSLAELTVLPWGHELQFLLKYSKATLTAIHPHRNHQHSIAAPVFRKQVVVKKVETEKEGRKYMKIYPPPYKMVSQSILLPGPERIRASTSTDNPEMFTEFPDPKTQTVCDVLISGTKLSSSGHCLGFRSPAKSGKYKWISYSEVAERKTHIGSGLINLGLKPSQKTMVGICTRTRPEFVLTLFACAEYSMVVVPLYRSFGQSVLSHIINQVEMEALIVEDLEIASEILKSIDLLPNLKYLILMDEPGQVAKELHESRLTAITLNNLEQLGKSKIHEPNIPKPDDLLCIVYTSGTTGIPKGVMLSHKNLLSSIAALNTIVGDAAPISGLIMCYLPCAHIYEIVNEVFGIYKGGRLGFYGGNTETLLNDIVDLKPSVLPLVPKLMNLIYSGAKIKIGPNPLRRYLVRLSLGTNERKLKKGVICKTGIWDKLILSKIQKALGGNIQMILSSSAPVSKEVMHFFRCSMGCIVFEAYGLSEVGAATMTLVAEHDTGFVGPPLPCNHIKLVDVPDLSYFSKNDEGEICVKGSNVFQGYYKDPETTKEVIDEDGWYHTGDIGKWLNNGTLSIIDRKKDIFKMSQGEYVMPEKIEGIYIQSHFILQVFVDGNSNQDFPVAIVVPEINSFLKWANSEGFPSTDFKELCQSQDVKTAVFVHLVKLGKRKDLKSLHQVGNIHLTSEPFSKENDLLTPTLKLKRSVARKTFDKEIRQMYAEGNLRQKLSL